MLTAIGVLVAGMLGLFLMFVFFVGSGVVSEEKLTKEYTSFASTSASVTSTSYKEGNCYDVCSSVSIDIGFEKQKDYAALYDAYVQKLTAAGYKVTSNKEEFTSFDSPYYLSISAKKGPMVARVEFENDTYNWAYHDNDSSAVPPLYVDRASIKIEAKTR